MRLDVYLVEKGFYKSRTKAVEAISRGDIFINGKICFKHSKDVSSDVVIEIKEDIDPFVSLGGFKLDYAFKKINPEIEGKVFVDVGASTGGFTHCLLRGNVKKVYCVDVGENLLDESISSDERVVQMDRTNARFLTKESFPEEINGVVVDCSFISLEYILPAVNSFCSANGMIFALIKPQFELNGRIKLKNGILKDDKTRLEILQRLYDFAIGLDLKPISIIDVTQDVRKNKEYIFYLKKEGEVTPFENILD